MLFIYNSEAKTGIFLPLKNFFDRSLGFFC